MTYYSIDDTGGGAGGVAISAAGNSVSAGTVVFSNSNGIGFGMAGSTVTASHNGLTSQSNQNALASNGNFNFQTLSFSNAGGVSFGTSAGSAIFGSVATSYRASNDAIGLNTAQSNVTWTVNSSGISFDARGYAGTVTAATNATFTLNSNGLSLSVAAPGGGGGNLTVSAAASTISAGSLVFSNSNNVSFGLNVSTITASASVATSLTAINVSAGAAANNLSAITFANGGGVSFGINASTLTAQVATSYRASNDAVGLATAQTNVTWTVNSNGISLNAGGYAGTGFTSAGANISFSGTLNTAGLSLSGSVAAPPAAVVTLSGWAPYDNAQVAPGDQGQATLHVQPLQAPAFQFDRAALSMYWSNATNSTGSVTFSAWAGLYTKNASTLSLSVSTSTSFGITFSGTVGNQSLQAGPRALTIPWTQTIPAGNYWLGVVMRTTTGGAGGSFSQFMVSDFSSSAFSGIFGAASNATNQRRLGQGVYTASTSGIPTSIAFTQLNGSGTNVPRQPYVFFASQTA